MVEAEVGIDALDIVFRLEKEFGGLHIPGGRVFWTREQAKTGRLPRTDPTAGEIHDRLCELIREYRAVVPSDSWPRVQRCIGDALGVPSNEIRTEDRLIADLGAS